MLIIPSPHHLSHPITSMENLADISEPQVPLSEQEVQ